MAAHTKNFSLNSATYTDISEGYGNCSFRLVFRSQEASARIRVVLASVLPAVDTQHYDLYESPTGPGNEIDVQFPMLDSASRCYARAASNNSIVSLTVYRS